jgi:hypothetical protein
VHVGEVTRQKTSLSCARKNVHGKVSDAQQAESFYGAVQRAFRDAAGRDGGRILESVAGKQFESLH